MNCAQICNLWELWYSSFCPNHDDVFKWKHFPRYWPFVRGIHRSPVNSPHKGQWRGALMFSLICVWINGWVNNRGAGDLRRNQAHFDVVVMYMYRTGTLCLITYVFMLCVIGIGKKNKYSREWRHKPAHYPYNDIFLPHDFNYCACTIRVTDIEMSLMFVLVTITYYWLTLVYL